MKKIYEMPKMEIMEFETVDITLSEVKLGQLPYVEFGDAINNNNY